MFKAKVISNITVKLRGDGVYSSEKMTPIYFLRFSKVWSILHHGSVGQVHKKCSLVLLHTFMTFFVVLHHKICVFIILISFFDEVSNFRNRILTNQKREFVVSTCQQNCMRYIKIHSPRALDPTPYFLYRIKTSAVKIRPALKKSYLFHELEEMKS